MIAEMLAMIRGDDDQRVVEHPARSQLIEEGPQLPIEIINAIVIYVDCHLHVSGRNVRLVERLPALQGQAVQVRGGPQPECR